MVLKISLINYSNSINKKNKSYKFENTIPTLKFTAIPFSGKSLSISTNLQPQNIANNQIQNTNLKYFYTPINFKANDDEETFKKDLLELENISCPFCGTKMLTQKKFKELIEQGKKINEPKIFANWLEENQEYIQPKYQDIIKYAKRFARIEQINTIEKLFDAILEQATENTKQSITNILEIIEKAKVSNEFSSNDKVLLEECQYEFENYKYNNDFKLFQLVQNTLKNTISNLENKEKYKLYGLILNETKKSELLERVLYFDKENTANSRQQEFLTKLFYRSISKTNKLMLYKQDEKLIKHNIMLSCHTCTPKTPEKSILKFFEKNPDKKRNLEQHISDLSDKSLNGELPQSENYPINLMKLIASITKRNLVINHNKFPSIKELYDIEFQKSRSDFELVNYSGIPCATCGTETFNHDDKVKKLEEIKKLQTNKDYVNYLKTNKKHIHPNIKPIVKEIINYIDKNPNDSEYKIVKHLKAKVTENIIKTLKNNITICKENTKYLSIEDLKHLN